MYNQASTNPWLSFTTSSRFRFPECAENRSWEEVVAANAQGTFKTGGLGHLESTPFGVWACWKEHTAGDSMCYVYNDLDKT
jgi:hypothetical protein